MFASPFIKPREALTPPVAKMNMLAHVSTQKEKFVDCQKFFARKQKNAMFFRVTCCQKTLEKVNCR